jgi:hypothetical protein
MRKAVSLAKEPGCFVSGGNAEPFANACNVLVKRAPGHIDEWRSLLRGIARRDVSQYFTLPFGQQ